MKQNEPIVLEFDEFPPSLNSGDGFVRSNRWALANQRDLWILRIKTAVSGEPARAPIESCVIIYSSYKVRLSDRDNLQASFKFIGDALVKSEILKNDDPSVIHVLHTTQQRVLHFKDQLCRVEIIPVPAESGKQLQTEMEQWLRQRVTAITGDTATPS